MRLRFAITASLAALLIFGSAKADRPPPQTTANAIVQTAAVIREVAQFASTATVVPTIPESAVTMEAATPIIAEGAHGLSVSSTDPTAAKRKHVKDKLAEKPVKRQPNKAAQPDAICVRAIGKAETGTAAWYGGRYVGRRTSSGSRLDTIHPTAAHRTLPLNSLARVTNLDNGRSVVVQVTDRGPVNASLLIDMSPRAAEELQMKHAGLVPVRVEQVVEVPPDPK